MLKISKAAVRVRIWIGCAITSRRCVKTNVEVRTGQLVYVELQSLEHKGWVFKYVGG
jgi:hypothetical protein